jgi:hypothetical protein
MSAPVMTRLSRFVQIRTTTRGRSVRYAAETVLGQAPSTPEASRLATLMPKGRMAINGRLIGGANRQSA